MVLNSNGTRYGFSQFWLSCSSSRAYAEDVQDYHNVNRFVLRTSRVSDRTSYLTFSHLKILRRHDKNILKVYYYDSRIYESFFHKVITAGTKNYLLRKFAKRGQKFDPKTYFKRSPVIIALKNFSLNLRSVSENYYLSLFKQSSNPPRNLGAYIPLLLALKRGKVAFSDNNDSTYLNGHDTAFVKNILKKNFLYATNFNGQNKKNKKTVYFNSYYKSFSRNFKLLKRYLILHKKMKRIMIGGSKQKKSFLLNEFTKVKVFIARTKFKPILKIFLLVARNFDKNHVVFMRKNFLNFIINFSNYLSKKRIKNRLIKPFKINKSSMQNKKNLIVRKFSSGRDNFGIRKFDKKKMFKKLNKFDDELGYERTASKYFDEKKNKIKNTYSKEDTLKEYRVNDKISKNTNSAYKGKNFDPNYHLLSAEARLEIKNEKRNAYELKLEENKKSYTNKLTKKEDFQSSSTNKDYKNKNLFYVNFNKVLEKRAVDKKFIESKKPIPFTEHALNSYLETRRANESGNYVFLNEEIVVKPEEAKVFEEQKNIFVTQKEKLIDFCKQKSKESSDLFDFEFYENDENFKEIDNLSKDFHYNKKDYFKKKENNKNVISKILVSNVFNGFSATNVFYNLENSVSKTAAETKITKFKPTKIAEYVGNLAKKKKLISADLKTFVEKLEKDYPNDYFFTGSTKVNEKTSATRLLKLKNNYLAKYPNYKYDLKNGWRSVLNSGGGATKHQKYNSGLNYLKYKLLAAYFKKVTPLAYGFINPAIITPYLEDFYQQMPMVKISASTQATVLSNGMFSDFADAKNNLVKHFFKVLNAPILDYLDYTFRRDLPIINHLGTLPFTYSPKLLGFGRLNAMLYARFVARRLKQRFNLNETMNVLRTFLSSEHISGYLFICSGRFSKKQRASTFKFRGGSVPVSNFSVPVQYSQDLVRLRYGTCCVKVWIASAQSSTGVGSFNLPHSLKISEK